MPIYEFRCLECDDIFEILFMTEDDKNTMACPKCTGENIERVLSTTNHTIKGSSSQPHIDVSTKSCSDGSCGTIEIPGGYD
ncbi:MAG: zinc ribbon domain-containing protein [Deltaproteobacteria bacterium]|nr:zinc ribbon domain-containing protein [Deltaproteobacteria bacterium]